MVNVEQQDLRWFAAARRADHNSVLQPHRPTDKTESFRLDPGVAFLYTHAHQRHAASHLLIRLLDPNCDSRSIRRPCRTGQRESTRRVAIEDYFFGLIRKPGRNELGPPGRGTDEGKTI